MKTNPTTPRLWTGWILALLLSVNSFAQTGTLVFRDDEIVLDGSNWTDMNWGIPSAEYAQLRSKNTFSNSTYSVQFRANGYGPTQGPSPADRISFFFGQNATQQNYYELTYSPSGSGDVNLALSRVSATAPTAALGTAKIPVLNRSQYYDWKIVREGQSGVIEVFLNTGNGFNSVIRTTDTNYPVLGYFGWERINSAPGSVGIDWVEVRNLYNSSISVTGFTLVNAVNGAPIAGFNPIPANTVIDLGKLGPVSVRANTAPATVGSVRFGLDNFSEYRIENITPYSIAGDNNGTSYTPWIPAPGKHTLSATPFSGANLTGTIGARASVTFTVKTTLEAENAFLEGGPLVSNMHGGFSGKGYVDYGNNFGEYLEWQNVGASSGASASDSYVLTFRYANGSTADRILTLDVNGTTVNSRLVCKPTGSWTTWATVRVTTTLLASGNTIRLSSLAGTSGPNVDFLEINGSNAGARLAGDVRLSVEQGELEVYPNPANQGEVTVKVTGSMLKQVTLLTSGGRTLPGMVSSVNGNSVEVKTDHLPRGIYLINVRTSQGKLLTKKLMVY